MVVNLEKNMSGHVSLPQSLKNGVELTAVIWATALLLIYFKFHRIVLDLRNNKLSDSSKVFEITAISETWVDGAGAWTSNFEFLLIATSTSPKFSQRALISCMRALM